MIYVSNCCGAKVGHIMNGTGMCSDCKEWCEVIKFTDENDEVNQE